jgi:hypothetical protein
VLKDQLQKWFDEAAWHAPSVIFFDDFDRMIPAEVEVSLKQYRTNTSPPFQPRLTLLFSMPILSDPGSYQKYSCKL